MAKLPAAVDPTTLTKLAEECCQRAGLQPERDVSAVLRYLPLDPKDWNGCCQGSCQPCSADLLHAANLLRQRLANRSRPETSKA